ncbi:MAG: hypothetical protein IJW31_10160 [Lentisphaeria bacterium]|nr:hypothetical protein [Lentisphaeria bacterium]
MKKSIVLVLATIVITLISGCSTVQITELEQLNGQPIALQGQSVAHLNAENWGLYFCGIPLITGGVEEADTTAWFSDTVNVPNVVNLATKTARKIGGRKTLDMTSEWHDVGFILYVKKCQVSANVVR